MSPHKQAPSAPAPLPGPGPGSTEAAGSPSAAQQDWLTFTLDGQVYGAPLAEVSEVVRVGEVTPVPGAATDLLGVRHLRGRVVPVMDGRLRLGLKSRVQDHPSVRLVLLAHRDHRVGVRVDAVGELVRASEADIAPPPPGRAARTDDPVLGVLPWKAGFIALLDVRRLCRLPEAEVA